MFCKFQHHSMQIFSNWRIEMSKNEKRLHDPPPHPLTLTAYPTPGKVVPPFFFMKMTAKDVKEITYMPLVIFCSVLERPGKNHKGVQQPPLVRRGLKTTIFKQNKISKIQTTKKVSKWPPNDRFLSRVIYISAKIWKKKLFQRNFSIKFGS